MVRFLGVLLLIILPGCNLARFDNDKGQVTEKVQHTFPYPEIPVMYTTEEQRLEFMILHYWSAFNFKDTLLVGNSEVTEQGLANYLSLLMEKLVTSEWLQSSLSHFCRCPKLFKRFYCSIN